MRPKFVMKDCSLRLLALTAFCFISALGASAAPTFGGKPVGPKAIVRADVPLSAPEKSYLSEGGNPVPPHAVAVLAVPDNFDPAKSWPVLVAISTSDFQRMNRDDLSDFYRNAAMMEGWVVIAGDGEKSPPRDTAGWRAGTTLAALDELHRSFPGSKNWPVAIAGFSGGAKRAGNLAPLLAIAGNRMIGIFMSGVNEDRLSEGYRVFHPGAAFLRTPVFISSGQEDRVASPAATGAVLQSIRNTGFSRTQLLHHPYGHAVSRSAVREALRWFRQLNGGG
jgi:predicted esterase